MKRLRILQTACALALLLMLAACTQDEGTDGNVQDLSEGTYPFVLTAKQSKMVTSSQTRVSENTDGKSSKWDGGEVITVQLSGTKSDNTTYASEGQYTLDANGSATAVVGKELYWLSTSAATVTAWYSNPAYTTDGTVNLSNQTSGNGLAYVLKAESTNVTYNSSAQLDFSHQLAKVRVQLTGEKATEVTAVKVKGYPSCTISKENGTVTGTGAITYLPMIKNTYGGVDYWEANLAPQTISKDDFLQINDNTTVGVAINATELSAGNCYTFSVNVTTDASIKPGDKDALRNISGEVTIKGNGTETANPIIITDNAVLTIENVNIKTTGENENAITVKESRTLKLIVKGTGNKLIASSHTAGGIILEKDAVLTITGDGTDKSGLEVAAGTNTSSGDNIPALAGIGAGLDKTCGNISISNLTLTVEGGSSQYCGGAAIGTSGLYDEYVETATTSKCGNITIENAAITATSGIGAAAIGLGLCQQERTLHVGDIKITGSTVNLTLKPYVYNTTIGYGAGIGTGVLWFTNNTYECGKIILDAENETGLATFTQSWSLGTDATSANVNQKIGKGVMLLNFDSSTLTFEGIYLNSQATTVYNNGDGWGSWGN